MNFIWSESDLLKCEQTDHELSQLESNTVKTSLTTVIIHSFSSTEAMGAFGLVTQEFN